MHFKSKLWLSDYLRYFWDLVNGRRNQVELSLYHSIIDDISPILSDSASSIRVLDLANGSLRPQYNIWRRNGYETIGIDLVNVPSRSLNKILYAIARTIFQMRLPKRFGMERQSLLVAGDVTRLPFADSSFELIISIAAFEHFLDVCSVLKEAKRVLKPGGVIWVLIHSFTALSGGHNISCRLGNLTSLPIGVEPWDHLRRRILQFTVPLNEWRIEQYVREFEKNFLILDKGCMFYEGVDLLTDAIKHELKEYSVEELTCSGYRIFAQKQ